MAYVTVYQGIVFIEGEHPRAIKRCSAQTNIGGIGAQMKSLNDLKNIMAQKARRYGCNCVVNFKYGQKTKLMAIDDVAFVGNGVYAILSQEDYQSIVSQLM